MSKASIPDISELHPQYITNAKGEKTGVILTIQEYDELMEDLAHLAIIAERRDDSTIPHSQLIEGLKKDGII